jgi:hypothetical protein
MPQARQVRQGQPLFSSANLLSPIYPVFFLSSAFFLIKDLKDSQSKPSERFATPNDSDQYHDERDDQQEMNEPTHHIATEKSQQPQN